MTWKCLHPTTPHNRGRLFPVQQTHIFLKEVLIGFEPMHRSFADFCLTNLAIVPWRCLFSTSLLVDRQWHQLLTLTSQDFYRLAENVGFEPTMEQMFCFSQ